MLAGWKTYAGVAIIAISAALHATGYPEFAEIVEALGIALGLTGLRAKLERARPEV